MLQIRVLIDNFPSPVQPELQAEHGLSFFIEFEGKRILCDMGASAAFLENAKLMRVDLNKLDFAFLSHGHADHTGGLGAFLKSNAEAPVYMAASIQHQRYYSSRRGGKREISTDASLYPVYAHRLKTIQESCWLNDHIAIVRNTVHTHPKPLGNIFLTVEEAGVEQQDTFMHEQSLVFVTPKGLVILSSCSHEGALNILDSCVAYTGINQVYAFVGGLHLVDSNRVASESMALTEQIQQLYPGIRLITGHCTGVRAREVLKDLPFVEFFHTGWTFRME